MVCFTIIGGINIRLWRQYYVLMSIAPVDLNRMYSLLSRITDGLTPLRERFENHVRKAGLSAIEKVAGENEPMVSINERRGRRNHANVSLNTYLLTCPYLVYCQL